MAKRKSKSKKSGSSRKPRITTKVDRDDRIDFPDAPSTLDVNGAVAGDLIRPPCGYYICWSSADAEQRSGFVNTRVRDDARDYVVAELNYDSGVTCSCERHEFVGEAKAKKAIAELNQTCRIHGGKSIFPLFDVDHSQLDRRKKRHFKKDMDADYAQAGFVEIKVADGQSADILANALNAQPTVWDAHVSPRPVPAGVAAQASQQSRNFEPSQGYLFDAPNGIGAASVWPVPGGRGEQITVCDIEGAWMLQHEDLPSSVQHIGGDLINDQGWRNHGTAVLGEMVSPPGKHGTVGICHQSRAVVQSAVYDGEFKTARAIQEATNNLGAGDVILIELHAPHPGTGRYVAMQHWPEVYCAIRVAVEKGITVVEAAGNGGQDFDSKPYDGSYLQEDSGAIMVGAGVPPTNYFDDAGRYERIGTPRSRIWFSNYGRQVNVQGWGMHVTTTGYGDAQGGDDEARWYTHRFSGTSSASPIVTGACACIQGRVKALTGKVLSPDALRNILITTGTPQEDDPLAPIKQHIGPQPNLAKAFEAL